MAAKIEKSKVGELASKAFYNLLKTNLVDNAIYAGVSYIPDSEWKLYTGSNDSESTFWGGKDSEYGLLDKNYYDQTMYSMHKALPGGISRVIPRKDWVYGTTYESYPNDNSYVLVKDYDSGYISLNVYRCVFSPRTQSSYAPTSTTNVPIELSDGYVWKYLYTITNSQSLRFLNDRWMPVPERIAQTEFANMTSDAVNYNQYISQINAEAGTVYDVVIDSDTLVNSITNDSDLRVAFQWTTVELIGLDNKLNKPSKTFKVQLNWDSENSVFKTKLNESGKGYIGPVSLHLDSDKSAIAGLSAYVAPGEGHGADVPAELKTNNIMISIRNIPDDISKAVYGGSLYNLLTLHLNPIDSTTNKTATDEFYIACNYFEIDEPLDYKVGDIIRPYYNDDGRRGLIISTVDGKAYYVAPQQGHQFDVFLDSEVISLENSTKIRTINKSYTRDIIYGSSDLLVADYKETSIVRNEGQIESFNFILSF